MQRDGFLTVTATIASGSAELAFDRVHRQPRLPVRRQALLGGSLRQLGRGALGLLGGRRLEMQQMNLGQHSRLA